MQQGVSGHEDGMTLVEILVVVAIIGLVVASTSFGIGALTRSELRSSCVRVSAAFRYAYHRSVIRGVVTRVAFQGPEGKMSIEEAESNVVVQRDEEDESSEAAVDPWEKAAQRAQAANDPRSRKRRDEPAPSPFSAITDAEGNTLTRLRDQLLSGGKVKVIKLLTVERTYTPEDGPLAVHFFPGGLTEHAVLHLQGPGDDVYAVEVHPLTGKTTIYDSAYEPLSWGLDDVEAGL